MTSDTFASILIVGLVVAAGPYAYVQYAEFSRIRQMEEHLPNFLRSIAEARRAGMTLPQAIANASKTDYGPLSPEIKVMAAQLSWGIPFPMVVELFNQRNNQSPFMQQSMGIIIEAYRSGGDVADTMDAVATDSRLVKDLEAEQKAKMSAQVMVMYVIHIIFLVIIYALNAILKPLLVMQKGEGMATMFGSSGGKALTPGGYRSLFMNMCYIEGIYNGLIAGEVGDGSVVAGFKHSLIMLSMAVLMFALVIKTELIGMQPLTISSYLYPDEQIPLDILVSRDDGTPVKRASVGAVITCSAGASCQEGQIVCKVDPACNMCTCARTDDWGRTKLSIKAPIEAGDYELKVVVVDDQVSKARISETAYFTVG
jgi:flagellar protein FlaJ